MRAGETSLFTRRRIVFVVAALAAMAGLIALGAWQLQRLAWKRDLIQRVETRIHAPAVPAPGRAQWSAVNAAQSEYLRVSVQGHYLTGRESLVQAVTDYGAGYWVLTPLVTEQGFTVLVNRGFVPVAQRAAAMGSTHGQEQVTITGLLRMSEPRGAFLRANQPQADRWYSRDVAAIAQARQLGDVAPYFIDAEAANQGTAPAAPIGGLTVVAFNNHHLQYALTWFGLALLLGGGVIRVLRQDLRLRRPPFRE